MKIIQKIILTVTLLAAPIAGTALVQPASAQSVFDGAKQQACKGASLGNNTSADDCAAKGDNARTTVEGVLETIINLITVIVGIAAVVVLIINGLRFITAQGDANAISSARNGVIYALIGLIIAAMAQVIVRFILNKT